MIQLYIYPLFFRFFYNISYYRILNRSLLVIYFIYSNTHIHTHTHTHTHIYVNPNLLIHSSQPFTFGNHKCVSTICDYFCLINKLYYYFWIPHLCNIYLSFSVSLTSLRTIISGSIYTVASALLHSFYGWVIFHFICVSHLLYPFIGWCTLRLLPCLDYYKYCYNEQWAAFSVIFCEWCKIEI